MSKGLKVFLIVLAIIVVGGIAFVISGLNKVVTLDENVSAAWSQVENQLQRRNDLIPNYVSTVKGYVMHEQGTFVAVTEARAKVAGAVTMGDKIKADNELTSALSRLLVVVEQYPVLKANENFMKLQDELAGTENRLAVERRRFNEAVRTFNAHIRRIPGNFFAEIKKLSPKPYYEVSESAKAVPKVEF